MVSAKPMDNIGNINSDRLTPNAPLKHGSRKVWPDAVKVAALTLVEAGESQEQVARKLGVPFQTLWNWTQGDGINQVVQRDVAASCARLADKAERTADEVVDSYIGEDWKSKDVAKRSTVFGTMVDKMLLLRGQPNSITANANQISSLAAIAIMDLASKFGKPVEEILAGLNELGAKLPNGLSEPILRQLASGQQATTAANVANDTAASDSDLDWR
jgi:transcriptional regulator with XRE-family HTH domain